MAETWQPADGFGSLACGVQARPGRQPSGGRVQVGACHVGSRAAIEGYGAVSRVLRGPDERVQRLLVPFVVGCLLLMPIQLYFHWLHLSQTGAFEGTLWEFFLWRKPVLGPQVFGWVGYHLWFLGFLFIYSLLALPLFMWFKRAAGQRTIGWLARLGQRRGGLFLVVIPLVVLQLALRPFFAGYQDWADFVNMLIFFVYGYILYADERFVPAVRRDWPLLLATGVLGTLSVLVGSAVGVAIEWRDSPGTPGFYLLWGVWSIIG